MPYSSMILPSFDEEKYMNKPDKEVPEPILVHIVAPIDEAANLAKEAGEMIAEVFGERSTEEIEREYGKDVSQDPPLEL